MMEDPDATSERTDVVDVALVEWGAFTVLVLAHILFVYKSVTADTLFERMFYLALLMPVILAAISHVIRRRMTWKRGWDVTYDHRGWARSAYYREVVDGAWQSIELPMEQGLQMIPSEREWDASTPEWAHGRRPEIFARIKQRAPFPFSTLEDVGTCEQCGRVLIERVDHGWQRRTLWQHLFGMRAEKIAKHCEECE